MSEGGTESGVDALHAAYQFDMINPNPNHIGAFTSAMATW
jgi:hypothetical protein